MRLVRMLMFVDRAISVGMFMGVNVLMLMFVSVGMFMRVTVRVGMFVLMILHGESVLVLVIVVCDDVNLGTGKAAAHHFMALKARTNVQGGDRVLE